MATCQLCGEPMPPGEEVFNYHGASGPCPKPPLAREEQQIAQTLAVLAGKEDPEEVRAIADLVLTLAGFIKNNRNGEYRPGPVTLAMAVAAPVLARAVLGKPANV